MKARASKGTSTEGCCTTVDRGGRIKILGDGGRSRSCVDMILVLPSKDTSPFILGASWDDMMTSVEHQVNATAPIANGEAAALKQFLPRVMIWPAAGNYDTIIRKV